MRMIREFRHLKLMKRNGRGNLKNGLISTGPSDLTVACPACPIPGINLQDDWEQVPKELRYERNTVTFVISDNVAGFFIH